jgi:hypothetical protein
MAKQPHTINQAFCNVEKGGDPSSFPLKVCDRKGNLLSWIDDQGFAGGNLKTGGGGSGTPGGPNMAIQFNDNGVLGGEVGVFPLPGLAWDKNTGEMTFVGAPSGLQSFLGGADANAGFQVDGTASPVNVLVVNDVTGGTIQISSNDHTGISAGNGIDIEASANNVSLTSDAAEIFVEAHGNVSITSDTASVQLRTSGGTQIEVGAPSTIGFFGASPVAKPTVTGSKGGNAALASLIAALASLGLIIDSTT